MGHGVGWWKTLQERAGEGWGGGERGNNAKRGGSSRVYTCAGSCAVTAGPVMDDVSTSTGPSSWRAGDALRYNRGLTYLLRTPTETCTQDDVGTGTYKGPPTPPPPPPPPPPITCRHTHGAVPTCPCPSASASWVSSSAWKPSPPWQARPQFGSRGRGGGEGAQQTRQSGTRENTFKL